MSVVVGVLGSHRRAVVDARGRVAPVGGAYALDWWVGADDRWHLASGDAAVRQARVGVAPVTETALSVPGGEAVQRVYGIGGPLDLVGIEIENRSPAAFAVALVLAGALGPVATEAATVSLRGRVTLILPRPPTRVAVGAREGAARDTVLAGEAEAGPLCGARDAREAAVLLPVAHRTTVRAALVLGRGATCGVHLTHAPSAADAARGWVAQLDRGMRVSLPDEVWQRRVDEARADVILAATERRPGAGVFVALEGWGLDAEAATVWRGLGWRARRAARRRSAASEPALLGETRDRLVREHLDGSVELLPVLPGAWRGRPLDVHDAPTRAATVSFALRWHGARPALLWQVHPTGRPPCLRAPGLDPAWSTRDPTGEALLGT